MSISGIKLGARSIKPISEQIKTNQTNQQNAKTPGDFGTMFQKALSDVNQLQLHADEQIEGLMLGKDGVTTHNAMIALEKADVAFQLMNQIRSKIVRAYQEVLRTQI